MRVTSEDGGVHFDQTVPISATLTLPASAAEGKGFHTVEATLLRDGQPLRTYRSGFWMRDWQYLLSGPKLTVSSDYFELDDKPLPVVGTTYMSGDVSRLYLLLPNAYVWDQDMAQIHAAGLNMIRTGLWTTWQHFLAPDGQMTESALRTVEAFLMCARHNNLPVQFNLFAFYPDEFGGENGYLDPVALRAESLYARSLVDHFDAVPFLAWDLINEPSPNKNLWRTLPDYDPFESAAWSKWIADRYPDRAKLLHDWAEPSLGIGRSLQSNPTPDGPGVAAQDPFALPKAGAFSPDAVRSGFNPLKDYEYALFAQSVFANWVSRMRTMIRGAGSDQLITVGQDEGGIAGRPSPAFYFPFVDFTADHTWWDYDAILWASLAAKFPRQASFSSRKPASSAGSHSTISFASARKSRAGGLERKIALAFAQGAGALEWVWNVNAYMANDNEITIGAIRPDGTEKPEAQVLAGFAAFANKSPQSFSTIEPPAVTMVTSQTLLYSILGGLGYDTQKHALRAIAYLDHTPLRMLTENRLADLGSPKLVILPSPQALTGDAWSALLDYVAHGGTLLVTGPVDRDEHWQPVDRMSALGISASVIPLDVRGSTLTLPDGKSYPLAFPANVQQSETWTTRFADGKSIEIVPHGSGKILWTADPVEFAEGYSASAGLYRWALDQASVAEPASREVAPLSPDVLAFPTVLSNAVLYSFSNESLDAQTINIVDSLTGAHIHFTMQPQRGAALLMDRRGVELSSYGEAATETPSSSKIKRQTLERTGRSPAVCSLAIFLRLLRAKHRNRFDLDEQLRPAEDCLDPGRSRQRIQSLLLVERGALFIEGFIVALDIAQIAGGADYIVPGAPFTAQQSADVFKGPPHLPAKVSRVYALAVFVDRGCAGDKQDCKAIQIDPHAARKRTRLCVGVRFVQDGTVRNGAFLDRHVGDGLKNLCKFAQFPVSCSVKCIKLVVP